MPQPVENISADLINLLKDRFEISDSVDEAGHFTDDPAEIKVFSFNFINKKGEDKGSVVLSLLDDSESANSIKVYFGQDLGSSDTDTKTEWYKFLQDLRQFAKMHLLGFDVRNINKSQITRRDVEKDLTLVKEDLEPMFEGSFLPIDGTVKTSHQKLDGEQIKIVIKHTSKVDPDVRGSRSRRIAKIYLVNGNGEKFLLPFKNLVAARAMARHIENGGTPYDNAGRDICQLVEEMVSLNKFYHKQKKSESASKPYVASILAATRERYLEIKKTLTSLSSKGGYAKNSPALTGNAGELEADDEMYEDIFDGANLDDESQLALPHVMRAYRSHGKVDEQDEFEKWINAAKGQGPGQDVIMDAGVEDEDTPEEKCPACWGNIFTQDVNGNRVCADCKRYRDSHSGEELDPELNEGVGNGCPDCPYNNEALPNYKVCKQCYSDQYGHSPEDSDHHSQEEEGHIAAEQDLTFLRKEQEQMENFRPYEYGGMNKSIPTSDEIQGGGLSQLESMSRLRNLVESADNHFNWIEEIESIQDSVETHNTQYALGGLLKIIQYCRSLNREAYKSANCEEIIRTLIDVRKAIVSSKFLAAQGLLDGLLEKMNLHESIPDREDNELRNQWTACEEYGHKFDMNGEELPACADCGAPNYSYEEPVDERRWEPIKEDQVTESIKDRLKQFFVKDNHNPMEEGKSIEKMLTNLEFELVAKQENHEVWQRSYYMVIFGINDANKLTWLLARNGKSQDRGVGSATFAVSILMEPEFRGELKRLVDKNNAEPISETAKPKCPHCGSTKYSLMPTDFETAKCKECEKNWDHGIVKGINDPYEGTSKKVGIVDELLNEAGLMEADIPTSSGWAGPLTWTNTSLGSKFHTKKEIKSHETTTGKLSPFSLLSSPEKDKDEAGNEIPSLAPRGVRSVMQSGGDSSGVDSMSQW